jgi:hypothetical protein
MDDYSICNNDLQTLKPSWNGFEERKTNNRLKKVDNMQIQLKNEVQ